MIVFALRIHPIIAVFRFAAVQFSSESPDILPFLKGKRMMSLSNAGRTFKILTKNQNILPFQQTKWTYSNSTVVRISKMN